MQIIATFDPNGAISGTFAVQLSNGIGKIIIWNESNWTLDITFTDGTADIAPAWTATIFELNGPAGKLTWAQDTQLTGSSAPISKVWVVAYRDNETIPGVFPCALVRQVNIGSTVSTTGTQTSVVNDGAALTPSNVFVEATPTGAASSVVSIATDGTVTIKGDVANVLTTLIQTVIAAAAGASSVILGDAARQVEVLGKLLVDGTSTFTGAQTFTGDATFNGAGTGLTVTNNQSVKGTSSLDNGAITTDGSGNVTAVVAITGSGAFTTTKSGTAIQLPNLSAIAGKDTGGTSRQLMYVDASNQTVLKQAGGNLMSFQNSSSVEFASFDASGFLNLVHSVNLPVGSLGQLAKFSGTGNGTVATGITNPTAIAFDPCTTSGSSQTIGGTIASSSVVTTGAAAAWQGTAWHS